MPKKLVLSILLAQALWFSTPVVSAADPAEILRQQLEVHAAGSQGRGSQAAVDSSNVLQRFYMRRNYQPVWSAGGELQGQLPGLLRALRASADHGFQPERYHLVALHSWLESGSQELPASLEMLATDALLQQALHRTQGLVAPRVLDPDWDLTAEISDPLAMLEGLVRTGQSVEAHLGSLWPDNPEYQALVRERRRILADGELQTAPIPSGALIRPGQQGERIALLRARLLGPLVTGDRYDGELQSAVQSFQLAAGLEPDGIVGDATLEVLNAGRIAWVDRIDANLERWRWLPKNQPDTYVRVNIASFTLRAVHQGQESLRMRVIAGRPARRSPVFTEKLRYLVFNPYWNVPFKLATQDKLPLLRQDPAPLVAQGYEVSAGTGGVFRSVDSVNWQQVTRASFPYQLRQKPGPKNALGQVKFMMPNRHAVYLHDTPTRDLFAREERAFSSGCIRLSEPLKLAAWVLRHDGQEQAWRRVEQVLESGETMTLHLKTPIPTYIVYFTAFAEEGNVLYRRDIYQRDAVLVEALRK